jgi:hypothetical protein
MCAVAGMRFGGPMTTPHAPAPPTTRARAGIFAGAVLLALLTYAAPFFGFVLSLALPVVTHRGRRYLWPSTSRRTSLVCSLLAWVGLWLPAIVDFSTPLFYEAGLQVSTSWLIIPLCGPDSPAAWFVPAVAAATVCALGLAAAMAHRRPWAWLAAAWLAPWVHYAAFSLMATEFVC